jgi:hypothetical protein
VLLAFSSAAAHAQGIAFAVVGGPQPGAALHQLELTTGELELVGPIGFPVTHIAFDTSERLLGVDPEGDQLLLINPISGTGVPIGPLGIGILEVKGLTHGDGESLWMTARGDSDGPSLYEVNSRSGAAIRRAGIAESDLGSLANRGDSVFLATSVLAEIDLSTGAVTPIPASGLGIWWARAIDLDANGTLHGLLLCQTCMAPFDVLITSRIETTTGTLIGQATSAPHGTWGLAILRSGVFLDGFESADLSRWSAATPTVGRLPSTD